VIWCCVIGWMVINVSKNPFFWQHSITYLKTWILRSSLFSWQNYKGICSYQNLNVQHQ